MTHTRSITLAALLLCQACGDDPASHTPQMPVEDMGSLKDIPDDMPLDQRPDSPDMSPDARTVHIEGLPASASSAPNAQASYTLLVSGMHAPEERAYSVINDDCDFDVAISSTGAVTWMCTRGGESCEATLEVSIAPGVSDRGVLSIACDQDAPAFTTSPPTTATERVPLTYPALCETDTGLTTTLTVAPGDTCGGELVDDVYQWTPTETQGGTSCEIAIVCTTDNALMAQQTSTVEVVETNETPVIQNLPASAQTLWGRDGSLRIEATDEDLPVQALTFSVSGHTCSFAPTIATDSGELTWRCGDRIEQCDVDVEVSDGELIDTRRASISCENAAPSVSQVALSAGTIHVLGTTLSCDYTFTDPDGDEDRSLIEWLVNGVVVASGQGFSNYLAGDDIACRVTPDDSVSQGQAITSSPLTAPDHAQVATTGRSTCALKEGAVWCWGDNTQGQLGDGTFDTRHTPVIVPGLEQGVTSLVARFDSVCAIQSGALYCWGQTGRFTASVPSNTSRVNVPTPILNMDADVTQVALSHFMCAVKAGAAYCWGNNNYGQLGDGTTTRSNVPVAVSTLTTGVTDISVGQKHACAIQHGAVHCWGYNYNNLLGVTTPDFNVTTPIALPTLNEGISHISVTDDHACAVQREALYCWGNNGDTQILSSTDPQYRFRVEQPLLIPDMETEIWDIEASARSTCVIKAGEKWCWGDNYLNVLGEDPTSPRATPLHMESLLGGDVHAVAFNQTNNQGGGCAAQSQTISCWGANYFGQLGQPHADYRITTPQQVPNLTLTAPTELSGQYVLDSGAVYTWGFGRDTSLPVTTLESNVSALDYGAQHGCAIKSGALSCWGDNAEGQLGLGANALAAYDTPQPVPGMDVGVTHVSAARAHTCAIKSGALYCWGSNNKGQLGVTGTTAPSLSSPHLVDSMATGVTQVAAGGTHTCSTRDDTLYCWGSNRSGQLGFRDNWTGSSFAPSDATLTMQIDDIFVNVVSFYDFDGRSCAVQAGQLYCWGDQDHGSFGIGSQASLYYLPVAITPITSGVQDLDINFDTTYLVQNGALKVAGNNSYNQFGDGTTTSSDTFIIVPGFDTGVTHVDRQCLLRNNQVHCWGTNRDGRLGIGTPQSDVALPITFP